MTSTQQKLLDGEPLDLLVIGAGIYGIQAARTYLTINPSHSIIVLEADETPGGVWSKKRMYPHFYTQSPLEIWEYSDKPLVLNEEDARVTYHEHFPARAFAQYLEDYIDEHQFDGRALRDRFVCSSRVEKLRQDGDLWRATTYTGQSYTARKVIDATGLTSAPNVPKLPGSSSFSGLQFHSKDFGAHSSTILTPSSRVAIIGGGKYAGDVAYACAKAGVGNIHWIIRKSGNGPASYIPADVPIKKYGNGNAAFHTSFVSTILASIFTPETWWTWFLYHTILGRAMHKLIWTGLHHDAYSRAKYDRPNDNGFGNLKPDGHMGMFWQVASSGVNQRADFFDTLAEKVHVYRQDIERVEPNGLVLQNGEQIEADVIVYATGWTRTPPYFDAETAYNFGLPSTYSNEDTEARWAVLEKEADAKIVKRFPILATSPIPPPSPSTANEPHPTPFRLYKSIIPIPSSPSNSTPPTIAFLSRTNLANHTYVSEIAALYAISVLSGRATLPSAADMQQDVAAVNAWMRRRYPTRGSSGAEMFFDAVGYSDGLLRELGMEYVIEERGLMGSMSAKGVRGMLGVYLERLGKGGEGKKVV
ncbi:hypothetical protein FB567DRAFT_452433 [Paraphoma chrysanthemicola]|uniref:FAD/NAD(P)-binding domain-containing protein n=1 Tax=Paraphoma chrysanthemicola TaxID=798071 RepID=A0A8K0QYT3_9PLEO|nr:hypothetical protein FB567DRAFT_452433 [Paraphoma chrysanthemicola]